MTRHEALVGVEGFRIEHLSMSSSSGTQRATETQAHKATARQIAVGNLETSAGSVAVTEEALRAELAPSAQALII